jgi:hypothetical protein
MRRSDVYKIIKAQKLLQVKNCSFWSHFKNRLGLLISKHCKVFIEETMQSASELESAATAYKQHLEQVKAQLLKEPNNAEFLQVRRLHLLMVVTSATIVRFFTEMSR